MATRASAGQSGGAARPALPRPARRGRSTRGHPVADDGTPRGGATRARAGSVMGPKRTARGGPSGRGRSGSVRLGAPGPPRCLSGARGSGAPARRCLPFPVCLRSPCVTPTARTSRHHDCRGPVSRRPRPIVFGGHTFGRGKGAGSAPDRPLRTSRPARDEGGNVRRRAPHECPQAAPRVRRPPYGGASADAQEAGGDARSGSRPMHTGVLSFE